MKRAGLVLVAAAMLLSIRVLAAERHDSAVFLIDVSDTTSSQELVATAQKISRSMNQKFPDYVKSAGAMVFGNLQIPQLEWIAAVKDYDRSGLDQALAGLKAGAGATPMGIAIYTSDQGLAKAMGKKALIIISDGLDNGVSNPADQVKSLKSKYSSNLCVFTIQLGDNPAGTTILESLVSAGQCGKATRASELQSDAQVQALVDFIFPGGPLDSDGDGVLDEQDQCPDTPKGAKVNKLGCWVLKDLRFETGKAELLPQSTNTLDEAVKVLKNNPGVKIIIEGHTDDVGTEESNLTLSQARADAVLNYMVSKGVDQGRLTAKGYGESKPIASNDTADGRAQNRRVQLTVAK